MYSKIYEFCKVKNRGNCYRNGEEPTPRVKWLLELLKEMGIEYELDQFDGSSKERSELEVFDEEEPTNELYFPEHNHDHSNDDRKERRERKRRPSPFFSSLSKAVIPEKKINYFYNIVLRGNSGKFVVAHHDIVNPASDNANDNSCSVINAIMTKKNMPSVTVILLDGEECGGIGSQRASEKIKAGHYGRCEYVLNLELTGKGGKYFFMGDYPGPLFDHVKNVLNPPVVRTPFNDAITFRKNGIDSVVINPIPPLVVPEPIEGEPEKKTTGSFGRLGKTDQDKEDDMLRFNDGTPLDFSLLYNCHSMKDSVDTIDPKDMQEFVEDVIMKILN